MDNDETSKRPTVRKETRMTDQDCSQAPGASLLMAEDTAVQLFQIAALMLGDEQEAVSLVEETVAQVETDPCAGLRRGSLFAGAHGYAADGRALP
jgi:hypothetical protein